MDAAYNSEVISDFVKAMVKVAIIDPKKPRGGEKTPLEPPQKERFKIRTSVERANSMLKENFGGGFVRVKGHLKVLAHLQFGIIAMTALQIIEHSG